MIMSVVRFVTMSRNMWELSMMKFMMHILTLSHIHILTCGNNYWYSSSLVLVSMVSSKQATGFLTLLQHLLGFLVWHIFYPYFTQLTIFWIVVSPHFMMRAPMISFIAHVFGLSFSIFGIFKFPLVLWKHLLIILYLGISFAIYIAWLWLFALYFLILRGCVNKLGELEVFVLKFLRHRGKGHYLILLWGNSVPLSWGK